MSHHEMDPRFDPRVRDVAHVPWKVAAWDLEISRAQFKKSTAQHIFLSNWWIRRSSLMFEEKRWKETFWPACQQFCRHTAYMIVSIYTGLIGLMDHGILPTPGRGGPQEVAWSCRDKARWHWRLWMHACMRQVWTWRQRSQGYTWFFSGCTAPWFKVWYYLLRWDSQVMSSENPGQGWSGFGTTYDFGIKECSAYLRASTKNHAFHAVFFRSPGLDICFEAILFSKGLHDLKGLFQAPSAPQEFAENAEGVVGRNHLELQQSHDSAAES